MSIKYPFFIFQHGKINISSDTKDRLPSDKYKTESRGIVKIKGKGEMQMFWLLEK